MSQGFNIKIHRTTCPPKIYLFPGHFKTYFFFFLHNQPVALIIPILFFYKTPHVSGIFSAHHREISTVHSTLVSFLQISDDRFQDVRMDVQESGWNYSSILTLLGSGHQDLHETYQCRTYSIELLMMGREDARNM